MKYSKLDLLRLMALSREGDRREGILLRQGKGWFQVAGMGHETMAVIAMLMEDDDYLFPYYRDRAMALARGVSNAELASAYFAKRGSSSGGRQMPGHYSDRSRNIWSVPTPTGSNVLPACGAAWAMQLQGSKAIAVTTVGDATSRQGEFYEAVAFAVERHLPVIFVIEDNLYGISTRTEKLNPFRMGLFNEELPVTRVDARHPNRVASATVPAMQRAREGGGPTILWCEMDRLGSHTASDDHRVYRSQGDIDSMSQRDPILLFSQELISNGELGEQDWRTIQQDIAKQVDREYQAAEQEADPLAEELHHHLYGEPVAAPPLELVSTEQWRMVDAINHVFDQILTKSPSSVFFGEDIEDPKGGVFRLTAGLSEKHEGRVFNAPLAEATILGVAAGMSSYGMRPVFELQFVDFMGPAWNQISQNLATLRWRSFGQWKCPCVIYAPYGAYLPAGSLWHSQANEALFAHTAGLRVVVPSTPEDAAGLMWTALHADDPTIFLIPKHLFRQHVEAVDDLKAVDFASARIRHPGHDVTVVSWGNCIEHALAASEQLADEVSVEVIDLRSLQPWDKPSIVSSVERTGRLVIVQEDNRSCSIGQMIISELVSDPESWTMFFSPPQLVSKSDVHIGYNPIYEFAALPSVEQVIEAVRITMEE